MKSVRCCRSVSRVGVSSFSQPPVFSSRFLSWCISAPSRASGLDSHRAFSSSSVLQADIFSQAFEQVEETLQQEKKKEEEKKAEEKLPSQEIVHYTKNVKVSRKRIGPLLKQIRGLSYREALAQLTVCPMRCAPAVMEAIEKCKEKTDKEKLNPERLLLSTIYATKGEYPPYRPEFKAKGRIGWRRVQTSHVYVGLKEIPYVEGERKLGKFARGTNKMRRMDWTKRVDTASKALNVHPLFITTRQVKRYEYDQEKAREKEKAAAKATQS